MTPVPWWAAVSAAVLLFWSVGATSRLKRMRVDIVSAFANLDTQLRRRHDVVQRLHGLVRPRWPAAHDALERLLAASNQVIAATDLVRGHPHQSGPLHSCSMAEDVFQEAHARLLDELAHAEEVIAQPEVSGLLDELLLADNQARYARGLFNETSEAFNQSTGQWPTRLIARAFGYGRAAPLSLSPSRVEGVRAPA